MLNFELKATSYGAIKTELVPLNNNTNCAMIQIYEEGDLTGKL